jgi:hypothetical protein
MNASCLGNVMLLERKRQPAKISKEHHFGRWWPFARQHFLYPLYIFFLYIQDSARVFVLDKNLCSKIGQLRAAGHYVFPTVTTVSSLY